MTLHRRRFLQLSALAAAPLVARSAFGGQTPADSALPVVIVGAGLAGLRAADVLKKAGRSVIVLEARGESGGRVITVRDPFVNGQYGEAGPIRISGAHQSVLRLCQELGLNLIPFSSSNGAELVTLGRATVTNDTPGLKMLPLTLSPAERGLSQGALLEHYVGTLPPELAELHPSAATYARWEAYDRMTWPDWLKSRGASPDAIRLMTVGGDSRDLSALYVLRQYALLRGKTQFYKIEGGMDRLPHAMAAALGPAVKYGAPVVSIDQSGDPIVVDYIEKEEPKRTAASHVIVTVPMPLLRDVDIYPALSEAKRRMVDELPYFAATRFLVQSYTRFWHESGQSGYARTDQGAEIWDASYEQSGRGGILGATIGGALGRRALGLSAEDVVTLGRGVMAEPFPALQNAFQTGIAHRWALEPWSKGAFAVFRPGQMVSMMPELARAEGRLYFAGEHTSSWMGWMEGALESGERAAREILG